MTHKHIIPVIMSGGAGSRLWPLSRQAKPKQLLRLVTEQTMVQETVNRFVTDRFCDPVFICNALHADPISEQMAELNRDVGAIIIEPVGRNTAPCAVVAAAHAAETLPEGLILLAPADQHIKNPEAFNAAIDKAIPAAKDGYLVTFGISPTGPETGYGYIERDASLGEGVFSVKAFKEKPDVATAKAYVDSGAYDWNAGIFLFSPSAFLEEINLHAPDILKQAEQAYMSARRDGNMIRLDETAFAACPSESIDYAVMEATTKAAVVPCDIGWSDIGSFASLKTARADQAQNAMSGDVIAVNTSRSLIMTDGPLVATVGLDNVGVIVHEGAVLVVSLDAGQDVKKIVEALKEKGRTDRL